MRTLLMLALCGLVGCVTKPTVIEAPPKVEYRDRLVVAPIAPELLERRPIVTGPLSECPDVAKQRRAELQQCNRQLEEIERQNQKARDEQ